VEGEKPYEAFRLVVHAFELGLYPCSYDRVIRSRSFQKTGKEIKRVFIQAAT